jgi:uncharacterized protein YggU (UPF0235/DUF167 family)
MKFGKLPMEQKKIKGYMKKGNGFVEITIYVRPRSHQTKLIFGSDEMIFYTKEPPENGRANNSLVKYLSKLLEINQSNIEIIRGLKDRAKILRIHTAEPGEIEEKLASLITVGEK